MAVYPLAVNMLIPRGTVGGAGQQPRIKPTIIILHTNASNTSLAGAASLMANTTKGQEYHFQQEASGTGRVAGRLGQYVDTTIRADNNLRANSFTSGGVLCGAISIETADHGTPYELSWTDLGQRRNLEDLVVWLCQTHSIPARRCPDPFSPGIGYHSMWGYNTSSNMNVNPWTNAVGKICPGPGKIREFPDLLAAVARRVAGGPVEEDDMAYPPFEIWQDRPGSGGKTWRVDASATLKVRLPSVEDVKWNQAQLVKFGFNPPPATSIADNATKQAWIDAIPAVDLLPTTLVIATETKAAVEAIPGGGGGSGESVPLTIQLTGTATPA